MPVLWRSVQPQSLGRQLHTPVRDLPGLVEVTRAPAGRPETPTQGQRQTAPDEPNAGGDRVRPTGRGGDLDHAPGVQPANAALGQEVTVEDDMLAVLQENRAQPLRFAVRENVTAPLRPLQFRHGCHRSVTA